MDLYFSPLACSMATRIALYEAGAPAQFIEVDPKTKRTLDGGDYYAINPLGLVPAVRTDGGDLLTENVAILQFVADALPAARLAPATGLERTRLQQWLGFTATELHKATFVPLLDRTLPATERAKTLEKAGKRLAYLDRYLSNREFLLERFSVADAYLFTVLNWALYVQVDLGAWPNVLAYYKRMRRRPSVARALTEERELFAKEQERHQAA